jgi:ribonucleoside-diphosphate reductase beta chain
MYTIFSKTSGCVYCDKSKELLETYGHAYKTIEFDSIADVKRHVIPFMNPEDVKTFPLIFRDGKYIGGYESLRDALTEPILSEDSRRYSVFPIRDLEIFNLYKRHVASFWTSDEISMSDDVSVFETKLNDDERNFILHILAFFSQADGIVLQNLLDNFFSEVKLIESSMFYSIQSFMESEHAVVYSQLIDSLVRCPDEKDRLFNAIRHVDAVGKKAEWAKKWLDSSNRFATRLLAFACVEGILFSGSFCAIYWLKTRVNMPGLSLSNQFIARDEKLHVDHAVALYKRLVNKLPEKEVHAIVSEAVENEKEFILDALPNRLVGMSSESMSRYIEYVADCLLEDLGYQVMYKSENPFQFMNTMGFSAKSNFFETRPSEYARAGVVVPDGSDGRHGATGSSDDDDEDF